LHFPTSMQNAPDNFHITDRNSYPSLLCKFMSIDCILWLYFIKYQTFVEHQQLTDWGSCMRPTFCCRCIFFFVAAVVYCTAGRRFRNTTTVDILLSVNWITLSSHEDFFNSFWIFQFYMAVCFTHSLSTAFLEHRYSQGNVVTCLGIVGYLNMTIANLPLC